MTLATRLMGWRLSARNLGRNGYAAWRLARPLDATTQWMFGIGAIVIAAALFLASALSLGIMLNHLRTQVQYAEHVQSIVIETRSIEDQMAHTAVAAQHYRSRGAGFDSELIRVEGHSINARFAALLASADPAAQESLTDIAPLLARQIAAWRHGRFTTEASQALAAFRERQTVALENYRADTDRQFLVFISIALIMALIGPTLGLVGISLLQRDRGSRRAKELQSELMHVQRLAVTGETAAMLAHEVSHPLTAASNYLAALRRSSALGDCAKTAEFSDRAAQQIHRAATILHRLRQFIEKRDVARAPVAPDVLIQDAVALLGPLDSDITLACAITPDLPDVAVDRIQIQQVLVNLIRNAVDAMHGSAVRRLTIAAQIAAPGWVEFSLSDTGPGLPPEIATKLFQPFHTTKKDGMGVGLSICRSIISGHRGIIWAEPNHDGGSVFRFRLPVP